MNTKAVKKQNSFTEGSIYGPLIRFVFPVLAALFLQSLYGAVDLLVVGQFADAAEVSAVSTGSQVMTTFTNLMASFAMGTTVLLGQQIGERERTKFVILQGIISAFCVRVPVSFLMSRIQPVSLFHIGLATPASSLLQVILCIVYFLYLRRGQRSQKQEQAGTGSSS